MKSEQWEIVFSDYAEEEAQGLRVEFPFYMQTYTEALSAILKNISYNQQQYSKKKGEESVFIGAGSEYIELDESNIFAFMGDRGSGKTSALYEFCRILFTYRRMHKMWDDKIGYQAGRESNSYYFHVMEPIDASALENTEDLMEVILANMYQVFQKEINKKKDAWSKMSVPVQKLSSSFDEVYRAYANMGNHKGQKVLGESVLVKLMNTSNSLEIRLKMEELVGHFLELLDGDERCRNSYLVVAIDDLDLNIKKGYEMLEQLHKYLATQKVIILVTMKYEQMEMICQKYIVDCLVPEYGGVHAGVYEEFDERAKKISNDYLLKVLPLANRIYMPERISVHRRVKIETCLNKKTNWSVKEFVLKKIALQMGIYYDAVGLKKHFCLPDTVRELVTYEDFLDSLLPLNEMRHFDEAGTEGRELLYDQNHERFNKDIEDKMVFRVLNEKQRKLFRLILQRDIKRRAKYAVAFISAWIRDVRAREKEKKSEGAYTRTLHLRDIDDNQDYCYADLLEALYQLGRSDYDAKPLVHCLLASFTSEMVREYYCYEYGNKEMRGKSAECLKAFLGKTFGGAWFKDFSISEVNGKYSTGGSGLDAYRSERKVGYINQGLWSKRQIVLKVVRIPKELQKVDQWLDILVKYIPYLECLTLCFFDFKDSLGRPDAGRWTFELMGNQENGIELKITNSAETMGFDIFGFIGKEFIGGGDGNLEVTKLWEELAKELAECAIKYCGLPKRGDWEKRFIGRARKVSIWHRRSSDKWDFPFYNLDMSYNVMKRVRNKVKEDISLKSEGIYKYFSTVYGYIAGELWREQDFYKKLIGGEAAPCFYDDFANMPFIKAFGIECEDSKLSFKGSLNEEMLGEMFYQALKGLTLSEDLRDTEDMDILD